MTQPAPDICQDTIDAQRELYLADFDEFASDCLIIRTKSGAPEQFVMNRAQRYLHEQVEEQLAETGKVRVIILKGRQQGCSTYVEGRYYWKTVHRFGVRTFILAHDRPSTSTIYEMAQRYHDNCPQAVKPHTGTSNSKELVFDVLDSGYKIGTAGSDSVGRGTTLQNFHGSEVAFWPRRTEGELTKGVLQAIPDLEDTEIFLESTANGLGGFFHSEVMKALRKESDYRLVFIPWYWTDEYRRPVPKDFERTQDEEKLVQKYEIDDEQLCWRRYKIIELTTSLQDGEKAFKQEYPFTIHEAFQSTGENGMILPDVVQEARKPKDINRGEVLVVGVDPSRGGDRFSLVRRRGRVMYDLESHTGEMKLGRAVQILTKILREERPDRMFVDSASGDLIDRLHELGWRKTVKAVKFGGSALDPERYRNKRCEMWGELNDWLNDEELEVQIPDEDTLESDLCAVKAWYDSMDRLCMESKDDMKKRGVPSPDEGDAAALTFAYPVTKKNHDDSRSNSSRRGRDRSVFE